MTGVVQSCRFDHGAAQLVYLVGFSYAFFWHGRTGLVITIGAICTLFVLMQATGRVNWHEVFGTAPRSAEPGEQPRVSMS